MPWSEVIENVFATIGMITVAGILTVLLALLVRKRR